MWVWMPYRLRVPGEMLFRNRAGATMTRQQLWALLAGELGESPDSLSGDATLPVLTLPLPLYLLLARGDWRDIVLLSRWERVVQLPALSCLPDWHEWAAGATGLNEEVNANAPVSAADLQRCPSFLRSQALRILKDDDEDGMLEFQLKDCLCILDMARRKMDDAYVSVKASSQTRYDVSKLWLAFQVCSCLRAADVQGRCPKSLGVLFPSSDAGRCYRHGHE